MVVADASQIRCPTVSLATVDLAQAGPTAEARQPASART